MGVRFTGEYRHGRFIFLPGHTVEFEDSDADQFFQKVGVAEPLAAGEEPQLTLSADDCSIDPDTVFPSGEKVLVQPDDQSVAAEG